MRTKITKIKILVMMLTFASFLFCSCRSIPKTSYGTLHFDKEDRLPFLNGTLLWDTGAEISIIEKEYIDRIPHRRNPFGFILVVDILGTMQLLRQYSTTEFNPVDGLSINNFRFVGLRNPPNDLSDYAIGLMGMDVIRHTNWLIDFNTGTVEVFPQSQVFETEKEPQMILSYRRSRHPKVTLNIAGVEIKNVLIDSGADGINLRWSDIKRINRECPPVIDTLFVHESGGLFSSRYKPIKGFAYNNMTINSVYFDDIRILESDQRFIGFSFFKHFNKVFLDTRRRKFYFYEFNNQ
jgi:hypothetical protein